MGVDNTLLESVYRIALWVTQSQVHFTLKLTLTTRLILLVT